MLRSLYETGHPWITFKDNSNLRYSNSHQGVIHSSNLCTEIFLHTIPSKYDKGEKTEVGETAVCNLSSVNLKEHIKDNNKLDFKLFIYVLYYNYINNSIYLIFILFLSFFYYIYDVNIF